VIYSCLALTQLTTGKGWRYRMGAMGTHLWAHQKHPVWPLSLHSNVFFMIIVVWIDSQLFTQCPSTWPHKKDHVETYKSWHDGGQNLKEYVLLRTWKMANDGNGVKYHYHITTLQVPVKTLFFVDAGGLGLRVQCYWCKRLHSCSMGFNRKYVSRLPK
jgi:hypothetical protein